MKYLVEGIKANEQDYSKVFEVKHVCEKMGLTKFTSGHYAQWNGCMCLYTKTGRRVAKYVELTEV